LLHNDEPPMCTKSVTVVDLDDERDAYEVESFLSGVDSIESVTADFLNDRIVVEYDENQMDFDSVLDQIEYAGCTPSDRATGVISRLKRTFS